MYVPAMLEEWEGVKYGKEQISRHWGQSNNEKPYTVGTCKTMVKEVEWTIGRFWTVTDHDLNCILIPLDALLKIDLGGSRVGDLLGGYHRNPDKRWW
jgi:hypothetical protein